MLKEASNAVLSGIYNNKLLNVKFIQESRDELDRSIVNKHNLAWTLLKSGKLFEIMSEFGLHTKETMVDISKGHSEIFVDSCLANWTYTTTLEFLKTEEEKLLTSKNNTKESNSSINFEQKPITRSLQNLDKLFISICGIIGAGKSTLGIILLFINNYNIAENLGKFLNLPVYISFFSSKFQSLICSLTTQQRRGHKKSLLGTFL